MSMIACFMWVNTGLYIYGFSPVLNPVFFLGSNGVLLRNHSVHSNVADVFDCCYVYLHDKFQPLAEIQKKAKNSVLMFGKCLSDFFND